MATDLIIELAPDLGNQLRLSVIASQPGNPGQPATVLQTLRPLLTISP